jgi:DNA-binding winged helix-turn-helix (wHTH) protein
MKVAFGEFTLDSEARLLTAGSRSLHLSPKAFSLLLLLLERRPAVVSKSDVSSRIWPNVTVAETSLSALVAEIRRALGDDRGQPRFLRTVHSVGYAFIGPVAPVDSARDGSGAPYRRCWLAWEDRVLPLVPGENTIGRDPRCEVWLDASGVSRRHARIVVTATSATIEDLGSRNGTAVGRAAVTAPRPLGDGDRIRVGDTTLTFRLWSDGGAPPTEPIPAASRRRRS